MRYFRRDGRLHAAGDDEVLECTPADAPATFLALARQADEAGQSIDAYARSIGEATGRETTEDAAAPTDPDLPVAPPEVWAAGVTYAISEQAREEESGMPEIYLDAYEADRPEIFFKATPSRTVGPGDAVGIRADSEWDVPEPELGIVLFRGEVVGYTVGNDVSSRSIEGANPLYLPQAKVYDRCCSLGPCVASPETVGDPQDLRMELSIERDGETLYADSTSTSEMVRTVDELVGYLTRHNPIPELCVLLTGTSLVPEDDVTLQPGDEVRATIESIGTLENGVVEV
jgi:2-dehydro-3-deoxy-D-arabinonate dehydratase